MALLVNLSMYKAPGTADTAASFVKIMKTWPEDLDALEIRVEHIPERDKGGPDHDFIGMCYSALPHRIIRFEPDYWNKEGALNTWAVEMHELGHCLCNLDHVKDLPVPWSSSSTNFADGCPRSLMTEKIMTKRCVRRHMAALVARMKRDCHDVSVHDKILEFWWPTTARGRDARCRIANMSAAPTCPKAPDSH